MSQKPALLATLLLAATTCFSQTQTLDGFSSISSRAINPITSNNEVKGYSLFYKGDKADRKNSNYGLTIFDENLKKVKDINLVKPKDYYMLVNNVFNESAMALMFYNFKDKTFEIETYSNELTKLGSRIISDVTKGDQAAMQQSLSYGEDGSNGFSLSVNILPVRNKGFIKNSIDGRGKGWALEMFDNKVLNKWSISSGDGKGYETIFPTEASDKYLLASLFKRDGLFSTKVESYLLLIDIQTGKKLFEIPVEGQSDEVLSITGMTIDDLKNEIVTVGDYYAKGSKPGAGKSLGFYTKRFNIAGKETAKKFYSWTTDVKKAARNTVIDPSYNNFTHKIACMASGKTYIVAEQFKRNVSAMGIASLALGGGSSILKGVVGNMLLFVVNPDLSLDEVLQFEKDRATVSLLPGSELYGPGITGHFMKAFGDFDYQFLANSSNKKTFNAVYVNYDKAKGEKGKKVIGNIILPEKQLVSFDKINMPSDASSAYVYPAKPGYIMMVDYLKKQKQLGMKLVKVNN
ncbi:MAG: hypothetical protein H7Y13_03240 [Sphingobacteriaceae bacterium]|nr:hypothetical protein [Sphingobacteriaceae bacterium]